MDRVRIAGKILRLMAPCFKEAGASIVSPERSDTHD
jgi:hypothetical protein